MNKPTKQTINHLYADTDSVRKAIKDNAKNNPKSNAIFVSTKYNEEALKQALKSHKTHCDVSTLTNRKSLTDTIEQGSGMMYGIHKKWGNMSPECIDMIIDFIDEEISFLQDISHIPYVCRRINKLQECRKEAIEAQTMILLDMEDKSNGGSK